MLALYEIHVLREPVRHRLVHFPINEANRIFIYHEQVLTEHQSQINDEFIEVNQAFQQMLLLLAFDYAVLNLVGNRYLSCLEVRVSKAAQCLQEKRNDTLVDNEIHG